MSERSVSDLVFRPGSPDGARSGETAPETLREELARLRRRAHREPRVVPAGRDAPPPARDAPSADGQQQLT